MTDEIRGMLLPLLTAFTEDGSIDVPVMEQLVDFYVDAGVNALFVGGSFGQGPAMEMSERKQLADLVIKRARGRVPVVFHAGTPDAHTAIELGKYAIAAGAAATAYVGPYYYDRTPDEVRAHFRAIGQAIREPILLYNNPAYQGYAIGVEQIRNLRDDTPHIIGAKIAMGSVDEARIHHTILGPDFKIFALGSTMFPGMLIGMAGSVSPPLAMFPQLGVEIVRAVDRHDYARALQLQVAAIDFHSAFLLPVLKRETGRKIYIAALQLMGIEIKRYPRWPQTGEVTPQRRQWLVELYDRARAALAAAPAAVASV
jgi:dihydrodipicolinate synthase/N-acetylneuraminate lyase